MVVDKVGNSTTMKHVSTTQSSTLPGDDDILVARLVMKKVRASLRKARCNPVVTMRMNHFLLQLQK